MAAEAERQLHADELKRLREQHRAELQQRIEELAGEKDLLSRESNERHEATVRQHEQLLREQAAAHHAQLAQAEQTRLEEGRRADDRLARRIEEERATHKCELQELRELSEQERSEHGSELGRLHAEHASELKRAESAAEERLRHLEGEHKQAMEGLRREHRTQVEAAEQDRQRRVGEIEVFYEGELQACKEAHEAAASQNMTKARKEFDNRLNDVMEAQEVRTREVYAKLEAELNLKLALQREQHDHLVSNLESQVRAHADEAADTLQRLDQADARMRLLKKQAEKDLDELREQLDASRDALAVALSVRQRLRVPHSVIVMIHCVDDSCCSFGDRVRSDKIG
jgi:hypothetical protein